MFDKLLARLFDKQNGLTQLQEIVKQELEKSETTRQAVLRVTENLREQLQVPPVARLNGTTHGKAHLD